MGRSLLRNLPLSSLPLQPISDSVSINASRASSRRFMGGLARGQRETGPAPRGRPAPGNSSERTGRLLVLLVDRRGRLLVLRLGVLLVFAGVAAAADADEGEAGDQQGGQELLHVNLPFRNER